MSDQIIHSILVSWEDEEERDIAIEQHNQLLSRCDLQNARVDEAIKLYNDEKSRADGLEAENKALKESVEELRELVKKSFVDGYNAGEDHYQKDDAWRYSWTKKKLEAITSNEYEDIEW